MSGKTKARPTDAELSLLAVLWQRGPSTVREIHEALGAAKGTGYTTTLKILQNMTAKELVRRDQLEPVARLFGGDSRADAAAVAGGFVAPCLLWLALQAGGPGALADERATAEELGEIRALLDELEARQKGGRKR